MDCFIASHKGQKHTFQGTILDSLTECKASVTNDYSVASSNGNLCKFRNSCSATLLGLESTRILEKITYSKFFVRNDNHF
jgi:hypothetical protein